MTAGQAAQPDVRNAARPGCGRQDPPTEAGEALGRQQSWWQANAATLRICSARSVLPTRTGTHVKSVDGEQRGAALPCAVQTRGVAAAAADAPAAGGVAWARRQQAFGCWQLGLSGGGVAHADEEVPRGQAARGWPCLPAQPAPPPRAAHHPSIAPLTPRAPSPCPRSSAGATARRPCPLSCCRRWRACPAPAPPRNLQVGGGGGRGGAAVKGSAASQTAVCAAALLPRACKASSCAAREQARQRARCRGGEGTWNQVP